MVESLVDKLVAAMVEMTAEKMAEWSDTPMAVDLVNMTVDV
jgi:hypothetical protein